MSYTDDGMCCSTTFVFYAYEDMKHAGPPVLVVTPSGLFDRATLDILQHETELLFSGAERHRRSKGLRASVLSLGTWARYAGDGANTGLKANTQSSGVRLWSSPTGPVRN